MTSNNYYINEYERLINRITLDDDQIAGLVEKITEKAENGKNDGKKQLVFAAVVVAVTLVGAKFLSDANKKK